MRLSRKIMGFAVAVAMFATQFTPVLADGTGTGNIIEYTSSDILVPTTFKFAVNPRGYDIIYTYEEATTYNASDVYYKIDDDGAMIKDTDVIDGTSFATAKANHKVYKGVTTDKQVVSLGYGIVNHATDDRLVGINFKVTYTPAAAAANKTAIEFVDTALKATSNKEKIGTEDGLADTDEMKMYLAVASANATTPKVQAYNKTFGSEASGTYDGDATYYQLKAADIALEEATLASEDAYTAAKANLWSKNTDVIGPYTTAAELSDVVLTAATDGNRAFVDKGTDGVKAETNMGFKLGKASYTKRAGAVLDINTSSSGLAGKLQRSAVGGVTGFTFVGALNKLADWSKADTTNLTITAVYDLTEIATSEDTVISGTSNQLTIGPEIAGKTVFTLDAANTDVVVKVVNLGADTIKEVVYDGNAVAATNAVINDAKDQVTIKSNYLKYFDEAGTTYVFTIVTENGLEIPFKLVRPASE